MKPTDYETRCLQIVLLASTVAALFVAMVYDCTH